MLSWSTVIVVPALVPVHAVADGMTRSPSAVRTMNTRLIARHKQKNPAHHNTPQPANRGMTGGPDH
jgi:hypothetical protein